MWHLDQRRLKVSSTPRSPRQVFTYVSRPSEGWRLSADAFFRGEGWRQERIRSYILPPQQFDDHRLLSPRSCFLFLFFMAAKRLEMTRRVNLPHKA
ncbi:hypothetical protein fugu_008617 [Takifugu bimaculatus]|uniref:Uncharacterized protein n=1 Tax=Takifugu bimaculatus TaxID=433685 RepID=A0A4Z2AY02_9TELE|nr:hypothetical protein fugu_008617 [Takifugu bimaculatus]